MGMMNALSSDLRHYAKLFMTLEYKITYNTTYFIAFTEVKMESSSLIYNYAKYILTSHPSSCTLTSRRGGCAMSLEKPKRKILKETRAWNPHPERVKADLFKAHPFFDPEDKVQVKYEMLRAREVEGEGLSETCLKFGFSRESYRHILERFRLEGLAGLFGHKPGRKGPVKATERVQDFIHGERSQDGSLTADELVSRCGEQCGVSLSRRTVFRILAATPESKKKQE